MNQRLISLIVGVIVAPIIIIASIPILMASGILSAITGVRSELFDAVVRTIIKRGQ